MRAARFYEPGKPLQLDIIPDPTPGEGQIVFKVARCGICGTDVHMTADHGGKPYVLYPPETTPGHEYTGEIVAIGRGVEKFKLGDRISAMPFTGCGHCAACLKGMPQFCDQRALNGGGFAEYALAGARDCILLPSSLTVEDGALVEPMAVGYHGAKLAGAAPGANVLIIGAGPVGLAAAYYARKFGAGKVAISATSRKREHFVYEMGADVFLDPTVPLVEAAREAFGGELPDVVYECVGYVGMLDLSVQVVRPQGTVVVLGYCTAPDTFLPALAADKDVRLQFSLAYTLEEFEEVARLFDKGHVEARSMITHTISLTDLPPFFQTLHEGAMFQKVLVDPSL
jgi:(R,R)-butanediol dehydrogenase/meso-butanediol dehydrogenase/diacetyl reductase